MKRLLYSVLFASVALLVSTPFLSAQTISEKLGYTPVFPKEKPEFSEENDVGYKKDISEPHEGQYWIKLEAYATGSAKQVSTSIPSDVILVLDVSSSMYNNYYNGQRRIEALKSASKDFVNTIYQNAVKAKENDPSFENRIAIVTYAGEDYITNATNGWVDVDDSGRDDLNTAIDGFSTHGGTRPELGLKKVIDELLSGDVEGGTARSDANLSIVIFTDGYPVESQNATSGEGTDNIRFNFPHANDAIYYAHELKKDYNATIFTVGLITSVDPANTWQYRNYRRVIYLMHLLSSNYPDAEMSELGIDNQNDWAVADNSLGAITVLGLTPGDPIEGVDPDSIDSPFFKLVTPDMDLSAIFKTFASQSGGSPQTGLNQESKTVDIISSSFALPEGADSTAVLVFTAPYKWDNTNKEFYFDTETFAPNSNDKYDDYEMINGIKVLLKANVDVDDSLTVRISDGNRVSIEKFDYADNWVGPITEGEGEDEVIVGAHGHKIIILVPIVVSEDAVGGVGVETNAPGSGIYDKDGNPLITFEPPAVTIPINIHINKQGLAEGESAKYTISRKTDVDSEWEYVTSVFVTRHSGQSEDEPIVKVKGLPTAKKVGTTDHEYVYKVFEEDWGWSYTFTKATGLGAATTAYPEGAPVEVTDPEGVTTDKFVVNPISFINSKTEGLAPKIRYAESKATNTFTGGGKDEYDDSKTNSKSGRTIITVESSE